MAALAVEPIALVPPPPAVAAMRLPVLYNLETHLAALLDTEDMVPAELEQQYALEFQQTLRETVAARDQVGQFRAHLKSQISLAQAEVKRLTERETFFTKALARADNLLTILIESLGMEKGKRKQLEGNTGTLSLHGCDKRVDITDEMVVPTKYKRVTVTLPAETWELVCDSLDLDLREQVLGEVKSPKVDVSLSLVKSDLKADVAVPGAQLAGGTYVEWR
jgi:hypothetical protein